MAGLVDTSREIPEGPGGWRAWWVWGAAAAFYLYEFFVRAAPAAMEPELQDAFHLSAGALGGVLGVYFYIYAPMQLVVGPMLDRYSAKAILLPAALVCALGCLLEAWGEREVWLGLARLMQGFGSAFAFVGTMYLASQWFPRRRLALLSGLTTSLGMVGAIAANAGIAAVVDSVGWRGTLNAAMWAGVVIAALIFVLVPHRPPHETRRPGKGEGLVGWKSLWVVLRNPQTWLVGIVATALYMPLSVIGALWGEQYISALTGENKLEASGAVSMIYVGWLIGGPFTGWLSEHLGHRRLLLIASGGLTAAASGLLLLFSHIDFWVVYSLMLILGLFSSPQVISFVVAVEHNPPECSGTAIAATNMLVMLFGGLGMALFGVILDWTTGSGDLDVNAQYPVNAYRAAMAMLPVCAVIGTLCAWVLKESIDRDQRRR